MKGYLHISNYNIAWCFPYIYDFDIILQLQKRKIYIKKKNKIHYELGDRFHWKRSNVSAQQSTSENISC